ncbi:MAG: sulfatase [Planctomycetota bacterium]
MLVLLVLVTHGLHAEDAKSRPNILFAFADDWGRQAGAYAAHDGAGNLNEVAKTPHFDAIAKRGVLFRNAYVNAPSCTPCRSSLFSGQYFWRTGRGAILQGAVWDEKIPVWPLLLRDGGYHIGKSWKVWTPGKPADAPFGGKKHAYEKVGRRINGFSQTVTKLVAKGQSVEKAKQALLSEVRSNFQDFLKARDGKRPFCYYFGPTNVHRKWIQGSGKKLWNIDPDDLKGKLPPFLPDVHTVREDFADYLGEVAAFDASLGTLVDELKKSGEYESTLIVVSGDHGPPGFPFGKCNLYDFGTNVSLAIAGPGVNGGRVVNDFVGIPDIAPTLLEAGKQSIPGVMTAKTLWPVLRSTKQGWVDATRTAAFTGRERHVALAREGHLPYPQRAIRTKDHLLIINFRPDRYPLGDPYRLDSDNPPTTKQLIQNTFVTLADEDQGPTKAWIVERRKDPKWKPFYDRAYGKRPREEFFDLKKDPHQVKNVASDPAYKTALSELRARLLAELKQTGDPRLVDDGKFFETPPMAGKIKRQQGNKRRR